MDSAALNGVSFCARTQHVFNASYEIRDALPPVPHTFVHLYPNGLLGMRWYQV